MAEVITKEQLENARVDAKDLGECVHGNESGKVTPRIGDPYPTLPAAIAAVENKGGYITAPTLAALNLIVPEFNHQVARVDESGDEYRWNPSATPSPKWELTGRNYLQDSIDYTQGQLPVELVENLYSSANNSLNYYIRPADGFIIAQTGNAITTIAVEAGKTYTVTATDMRASYLIVSCSATSSVSGGKQNTLATLNSTADPNIKTFTVPIGMKYAFINVLWPNFNFDIRSSLVVQEGSALKYAVKSARGVPIIDTLAQQRLDDFESEGLITGTSVLPSDSGPVVVLTTHNDLNIAPTTGVLRTSVGCKLAQFNIVAGKRYKIKAPDLRAAYVVVSVSNTSSVSSGKAQTLATLTELDATTKIFTAPENMISACINTVWPNFNLDISTSLSVEELEPFAVSQIAGAPIVDTLAQEKIKALEESSGGTGSGYISILKNKKWVFIGDSITASDNAWATTRYHDYVVNAVGGMTTQNLGISSSGYGDRTTAASYITLPSPDYITLFMGTNDFGYLNDLRNSEGKPYPMGVFLSSTNLTVSGAINLTLQNIFAAYPLAKVAIITPLPRGTKAGGMDNPSPNFGENPAPNVDGVNLENIANELIRYAKHYSLPILDLYHQSNFLASSSTFQNACMTDGVHPNDAGHAIIGQKVLKFLESI